MRRLPSYVRRLSRLQSSAGDWWHGLQLAVAVVAAYACSAALRLPEGLWAVMSALIVLRPTMSATAGAGWDRVRGTLAGTAFALASIAFLHVDRSTPLLLLSVVLAIAFCAGLYPSMRSAPISALIVLSIGAGPAHSAHAALEIAILRSAEIVLGVTVGLAISWVLPTMSARRRFPSRCAAVLRNIAEQVQHDLCLPPMPERESPASMVATRVGTGLRSELRALAVLAVNADHESRLADLGRWRRNTADRNARQRTAQLLARTAQDAALFGRMADPATAAKEDEVAARQALCDRITSALHIVADVMEGDPAVNGPEVGMRLRDLAGPTQALALPWALAPAKLLVRDLTGLLRG